MKTKILYIAITAVISLSTINVFADGTKGKKETAKKNNTTVTHIATGFKEVEMELENWMTSLSEFNIKSETWIEETPQFEDWILKDFNVNNVSEKFQDNELILEGWMLESFDAKTQEIFTDEELEFEPWMFEKL